VTYPFLEATNRKDLVLVRHLLSHRPYKNKETPWDAIADELRKEIDRANGKFVFAEKNQILGRDIQLRFHAYMEFAKQMIYKQASETNSPTNMTFGETEIWRGIRAMTLMHGTSFVLWILAAKGTPRANTPAGSFPYKKYTIYFLFFKFKIINEAGDDFVYEQNNKNEFNG
jgi:hypothetical protein